MTSTVKNIKVGNTSYPVQDTKATPFLSSTDETTLLSNGTYRGETVANGTIFTKPDGTLNEFSATPISPTWVSSSWPNASLLSANDGGNVIMYCPNTNQLRYVQVSTNGGSTWTQRNPTGSTSSNQGGGLCYHKGRWYFKNRYKMVYSEDNGVSWTDAPSGWYGVAYDTLLGGYLISNGEILLDLTTGDPHYLDESTNTWINCSMGTSSGWSHGTVDPVTKDIYLASESSVVCRSSDGKTFTTLSKPYSTSRRCFIAAYNGLVVYTNDSAVFYSTDKGATWNSTNITGSITGVRAENGVFIIQTRTNSNLVSTDGYTWSVVSGTYASPDIMIPYNGYFHVSSYSLPTTLQYRYNLSPLSCTATEVDTALNSKQDTLTAGTGITITGTAALSSGVTVVGTPTMTAAGIASGFSDTNYYSTDNMLSSATRSFEIVTAVNMTTAADNNLGIFDSTQVNSTKVGLRLTTSATNTVRLRVSIEGVTTYPVDITGTTPLTVGTKIWIKATYDSNTGYALYTSTDGSTWTTEGTSALTTAPYKNDGFWIGDNSATDLSLTGSIYMLDTYTKVDDVINWRAAKVVNPVISATGGGGSSYTAGTGIAIDSSNVISNTGLINTATGTDSLTILGSSATDYDATNIGKQSYSGIGGVAVGRTASAGTLSVAVGKESFAYGGNYATAIGGVARATAERAIAIGYGTNATASHAIQIGRGSNSTANTMNVGLSSSLNVQLLDSSGNIPAARLSNIYEVVQTLPASPTAGKIYFVTGS